MGRGRLEGQLALLQVEPGRDQSLFQRLHIGGLPELEADGIVGCVIAIVEGHQVVGSDKVACLRVPQEGNLVKVLAGMDEEGVVHAEDTLPFDLGAGQLSEHPEAGLVQRLEREGALGEQTVETALIAAVVDEQAVDAVDRLVLGDNQPADVAFEFDEGFGREDLPELLGIMFEQLRKSKQGEQTRPPSRKGVSEITARRARSLANESRVRLAKC